MSRPKALEPTIRRLREQTKGIIRSWLATVLADLGGDRQDVAAFLESKFVRGHRDRMNTCPVATWFRHLCPDESWLFLIDKKHIAVIFGMDEEDYVIMDTPKGISDFIVAFDKGVRYPNLSIKIKERPQLGDPAVKDPTPQAQKGKYTQLRVPQPTQQQQQLEE